MQHFLKTFWFRTFHWHAVGGMQWRFLEPQFFQTWACSPDYLNQYIIWDTFNQTFFFSGFYILFQTSTPHLHLLWLFPHPICAEMSSDCYFQLRVSKLNKWYFKNAFILTEHRVEPAERITDLPPSKTFTGSIFWMQNPSTLLLFCSDAGDWLRPRWKWWTNVFHLPHIFRLCFPLRRPKGRVCRV